VNNGIIKGECPRYTFAEDWDYIVPCVEMNIEKRQFIIDLYNDLQKDPSSINKSMEVLAIIFHILQYLKNKDGIAKMMQSQIGVNMLFRGYIIRD